MTHLLVIGLDAATWSVIKPNLGVLPNFKQLMEEGQAKSLFVEGKILSAAVWCTIFSGKSVEEHGHDNFIKDGNVVKREDIKVEFIWDVLDGICDIRALQIPFVYPPYNFKCDYTPVEFGLSSKLDDLEQDTDGIFYKAIDILEENPDVFIVVFTALDKLQHFHWGEPIVLEWYKKFDKILGVLSKLAEKLIVVSDHGFCAKGEARERTLPDKTPEGELKGDHHEEAILITRGISYPIKTHKDIFYAIKEEVENAVKIGKSN
ncbi:hypothetical protein DRJ48_00155 [Candidatus Woesearchaeota archaeon]|nr:alkaline phosphatase family protein [Candidatus Woesearchaeota archaeon]RLE43661.1 MAG: hypothetical protein DRJ48_00155 [Candidatus Woesearchaeota archaeon]